MAPAMNKKGIFITFEGGDGAGKSTHIRFLASALEREGYEVLMLREPGGTSISESLRGIVLDPANDMMADRAELLIYEAARAQLVEEVIKPALAQGTIVLCDRFTDSTIAYQAFGRGLDKDFVAEANAFACNGITPVRTIMMVAGDAAHSIERATREGSDRLELAGLDFHTRVLEGFAAIAAQNPERIKVVHSAEAKSDTSRAVFEALKDLFPWMHNALETPEYFAELDEPKKK